MMANTTLTADLILIEAQRMFQNNTPFIQGLSRSYDGTEEALGAKAGSDIRIRKPMKYTVRTGKTANVQDATENSVTLSKSTMKGVDLKFSSAELTQDMSDFSRRIIAPAVRVLSSTIENDIMTQAVNATYNQVGTEGTDPATAKVILDACAKMDDFSAPLDGDRQLILNPAGMASTVDGLKALFNPQPHISKQYIKGQMGTGLGFDFAKTSNIPSHTSGTSDKAYLVNGASQTGASLIVDTGTGTWTEGDTFTIAGVNAVNPTTKVDSGQLQTFVVTAAYAGGGGTVSISPSITVTGAAQTVTASPANNAVITESTGFVASASNRVNLAYDNAAYAFGTAPLELPNSLNPKAMSRLVHDNVSMRLLNGYDIINDDTIWRLDILYGFVAVTPEWACRVAGA